jgi:NADP-dependent 3-hydroxy acid dehydrogenase YdfG
MPFRDVGDARELCRPFKTNVLGPWLSCKQCCPICCKRSSGHILNVISMDGIITMPGIAFHHGSKFAREGISENLGKRGGSFVNQVMVVELRDQKRQRLQC